MVTKGRFSNLKPPKYKIHPVGTKVKRESDGKKFTINKIQMASYKWGTEANYQLKLIGGKGGTLMVPEKNLRDYYKVIK
jgi:hypothetical protein